MSYAAAVVLYFIASFVIVSIIYRLDVLAKRNGKPTFAFGQIYWAVEVAFVIALFWPAVLLYLLWAWWVKILER